MKNPKTVKLLYYATIIIGALSLLLGFAKLIPMTIAIPLSIVFYFVSFIFEFPDHKRNKPEKGKIFFYISLILAAVLLIFLIFYKLK